MLRDIRLYVEDMRLAIDRIIRYTNGVSLKKFVRDEKTQDAVVRNLEILGEAARRIPVATRKKYSSVPWREIIGMRNKVIHEYFGVDVVILWKTIQGDIPLLKKEIRKLSG